MHLRNAMKTLVDTKASSVQLLYVIQQELSMSGACQIGINGNGLWISAYHAEHSISGNAVRNVHLYTCSRHRLAGIEEPVNKTIHETKMHT